MTDRMAGSGELMNNGDQNARVFAAWGEVDGLTPDEISQIDAQQSLEPRHVQHYPDPETGYVRIGREYTKEGSGLDITDRNGNLTTEIFIQAENGDRFVVQGDRLRGLATVDQTGPAVEWSIDPEQTESRLEVGKAWKVRDGASTSPIAKIIASDGFMGGPGPDTESRRVSGADPFKRFEYQIDEFDAHFENQERDLAENQKTPSRLARLGARVHEMATKAKRNKTKILATMAVASTIAGSVALYEDIDHERGHNKIAPTLVEAQKVPMPEGKDGLWGLAKTWLKTHGYPKPSLTQIDNYDKQVAEASGIDLTKHQDLNIPTGREMTMPAVGPEDQ